MDNSGTGTSRLQQDTRLRNCVARALQARDRGETVDMHEICEGDATLVPLVAEALGIDAAFTDMHEAAMRMDPLVGSTFNDRYRVEHALGRGAMGVVYSARDPELERDVAIKVMQTVGADAEARFLREGRALAALSNPHIVPVHDFGRSQSGHSFLVMERLSGASLATILAARPEDTGSNDWLRDLLDGEPPQESFVRLLVAWIADLAGALRIAHEAGLYHRDIKPSNIFITDDYKAVLIDFGLVKGSTDADLSASREILGTPQYMAPEQARGEVIDPARLDVYELSATLYHALSGRAPFSGDPVRIVQGLASGIVPPPIETHAKEIHRDLRVIVECGMAHEPRHRYGEMSAIEADLRAFLDHRPVSVRPLGRPVRLWRAIRRRPQRAVAIGSAILAVLLVCVVVPLAGMVQERRRGRTDCGSSSGPSGIASASRAGRPIELLWCRWVTSTTRTSACSPRSSTSNPSTYPPC